MSMNAYATPVLVKHDVVVRATLGSTQLDIEPVAPPMDKRF